MHNEESKLVYRITSPVHYYSTYILALHDAKGLDRRISCHDMEPERGTRSRI